MGSSAPAAAETVRQISDVHNQDRVTSLDYDLRVVIDQQLYLEDQSQLRFDKMNRSGSAFGGGGGEVLRPRDLP